ncbi:hypothetical protein ACHAO9_011439 [Fusarium lateritium]
MAPTWNPTSSDQQQIKEAFADLGRVTDKVVFPSAESSQPNRFILRSKSLFDVQAYVLSGKDLPGNPGVFDGRIPRSAFRKLSGFDPEVQHEIVVRTGYTCSDYHNNHLHDLVRAGQVAMQFSDNTVELLVDGDGFNLRHNLSILTDERYTSPNEFDENYREAQEAIQMTLSMLVDDARDRHRQTENIMQSLMRFEEDTRRNQQGSEYLTRQFKTGPVANHASDNKTPYLEFINKNLAESLTTFSNVVKDEIKRVDLEKSTTTAIGTCQFAGLGYVAMSVDSARSKTLRDAYDNLQNQISRSRQESEEETSLILFVNQILAQNNDIDRKINDAVNATRELNLLFEHQARSYEKITRFVHRMEPSPDLEALKSRKMFVLDQVDTCANKLRQLKTVAEQFIRSFNEQIRF